MIDVLSLLRIHNYNRDDSYFASYSINGITSWIFINIDDFYNWLKENIPDYNKELRARHFFFKKYSIIEDFKSNKPDRVLKARNALNQYFESCYKFNGLQDFSKMIDLQSMSPLFRDVQLSFVEFSSGPFISIIDNNYLSRNYGSNWLNDLISEGNRIGVEFFNDGAGHLSPQYNFRTLFYDSGPSRELQVDRNDDRENENVQK